MHRSIIVMHCFGKVPVFKSGCLNLSVDCPFVLTSGGEKKKKMYYLHWNAARMRPVVRANMCWWMQRILYTALELHRPEILALQKYTDCKYIYKQWCKVQSRCLRSLLRRRTLRLYFTRTIGLNGQFSIRRFGANSLQICMLPSCSSVPYHQQDICCQGVSRIAVISTLPFPPLSGQPW